MTGYEQLIADIQAKEAKLIHYQKLKSDLEIVIKRVKNEMADLQDRLSNKV